MPELPEVETVMRGLMARLDGRVLQDVEVRRGDLRWPMPQGFAQRVRGRRVIGFRRRGKYILMRLDDAASVLLHLGMSGRMVLSPPGSNAEPPAHEHVVLRTEEGWRVGFVDPRRFGSVDLVDTAAEDGHRLLAGLGPEPLGPEFTVAYLDGVLAGKATPAKAALLDQGLIAGLGNIYVAEALFRARISPQRSAGSIPGARSKRLVPAIRQTLEDAIAAGGSSLREYVQPDGELGYFQHAWRVYGKEGEPCPDCPGGSACGGVRRVVQSGRSSFYCPKLQR
jgi:formamidopyrimidine-DNA glycosylase